MKYCNKYVEKSSADGFFCFLHSFAHNQKFCVILHIEIFIRYEENED